MISKEEYVLERVKMYEQLCAKEKRTKNSEVLNELIEQWTFDYEMEKQQRPEVLKKPPTLEELLSNINTENRHEEIDFGRAGRELL